MLIYWHNWATCALRHSQTSFNAVVKWVYILFSPKLAFTNSRRKFWYPLLVNSSELSKPCSTWLLQKLCWRLLLCLKVWGSNVKVQWGSASRTLSASGVRITKFGYLERGLLSALLPNCQPIKHLHFKYISCLGQAAAPDQNYHLHFFTAEVTGSRAERMQVRAVEYCETSTFCKYHIIPPAGCCCQGWVWILYSHMSPSPQQVCRMQPPHNIDGTLHLHSLCSVWTCGCYRFMDHIVELV